MKKLLKKIWIYIRPFVSLKFLISYIIPFMIVNGWAWIGAILLPFIGANWFTVASTTWLSILFLPFCPEKLITLPLAIFIHKRLFKNDEKTHNYLNAMYDEANTDWQKIKNRFKRKKSQ